MAKLGTPLSPSATRVLLLGSGELGKEVAIELQRLGVEVIAADRYADAPAMQVAHRSHVIDMLDAMALRALMPITGHFQIASVPSRHEPTTEELNDVFLFSELDRLNYSGFVGCEYNPRAGTLDGLGWFVPYRR